MIQRQCRQETKMKNVVTIWKQLNINWHLITRRSVFYLHFVCACAIAWESFECRRFAINFKLTKIYEIHHKNAVIMETLRHNKYHIVTAETVFGKFNSEIWPFIFMLEWGWTERRYLKRWHSKVFEIVSEESKGAIV